MLKTIWYGTSARLKPKDSVFWDVLWVEWKNWKNVMKDCGDFVFEGRAVHKDLA